MRLVQYSVNSDPTKTVRVGVRKDDRVHEVNTSGQALRAVLQNKPDLLDHLDQYLDRGSHSRNEVTFLSPITDCDKLICVGMNYKDHCEEQNCPVPEEPIFFSKFSSCIVGPTDPIPYPEVTSELDYEVELAVVIGKKGKNIPKAEALNHVLGYTVAHDVSARDWQLKKNGGQWLIGKTMDAFCPLGPEIVTGDEIGDPHNLKIKCRVNGVTKQDSNTNQLVHRIDDVVSKMSTFVTLLPGDVILTGTPPGVGVFQKPPFFLKKGDVVECEIENIGVIRNAIA